MTLEAVLLAIPTFIGVLWLRLLIRIVKICGSFLSIVEAVSKPPLSLPMPLPRPPSKLSLFPYPKPPLPLTPRL
jgi:hypothetical protein